MAKTVAILTGGMAAIVAACTMTAEAPRQSGGELYAAYCTSCHGTSGKGDGPLAGDLPRRPADLAAISARNGGSFPMAKVMSTPQVFDGWRQTFCTPSKQRFSDMTSKSLINTAPRP